MKIKIRAILFIVLLFCSEIVQGMTTQTMPPPHSTNLMANVTAFANHIITHSFYLNGKIYALLDDHSLWELRPDQTGIGESNHDSLVNNFVTLMPSGETRTYPVRFIIPNIDKHFIVNLVSVLLI